MGRKNIMNNYYDYDFNNYNYSNNNVNNNIDPYKGFIRGNIFDNLYDPYKNYKPYEIKFILSIIRKIAIYYITHLSLKKKSNLWRQLIQMLFIT